MAGSAREQIAQFVEQGNVRHADAAVDLASARVSELAARLDDLQAANTPIPDAEAAPADFAAAVQAREKAAKEIKVAGRDVPRWNAQNPIMQRVYGAHDAITDLPAPGGLGALLIIIAILFFVLISATAQGETRTLLLWEVLLGKKRLPDRQEQVQKVIVGGLAQANDLLQNLFNGIESAITGGQLGNQSTTTAIPTADVTLGMPGEGL